MTISIRPATLRDMTYIAAHMRAADRREITAVYPATDTEIGRAMHQMSEYAWTAWIDDAPVAAFGMTRDLPGLGTGWAYGTDRLRRTVPAITRFIRTRMPEMIEIGIRRVEVRTAIDHDISHRWLEALGFQREGIARHYGADGLHYAIYAFTEEDA